MNEHIVRKNIGGLEKPPIILKEKYGIPYFSFPLLEETKQVEHAFTSRKGGVSEGMFSTMNLSFTRGDKTEHVLENYKHVVMLLNCSIEDIVCSDQTHTTNIRIVTKEDAGKGIVKSKDYTDIDGLLTNEEGICLATFYADCVPVYFVDPIKRVIGLAHSGWKGTANKIVASMVNKMKDVYGCNPSDIVVAIGPSICQDCYEVSEEVANFFSPDVLKSGKEKGKFQLDLWKAVEETLLEALIKKEHIATTDICTCCNPELLFSHRASSGKRGNLGAFLKLKES